MTARLLRLTLPRDSLPAAEEIVGALGAALWADTGGDRPSVPFEVTLPPDLAPERLEAALLALAELCGVDPADARIEELPDRDWVKESQKALPPQHAGRFWVYGSHVKEAPPAGTIPLLVEASLAFGTGRHESTQGCLIALSELAEERGFTRILDLGTGSGVLAMAAAKLWPEAAILAVDNDAPSLVVARENAQANGVGAAIAFVASDGFAAPALAAAAPFDLILANILAEPLIAFAPALTRHLASDGLAVLAGLLSKQAPEVTEAYENLSLRLVEARRYGEWETLLLKREV